ncbi:MAG: glycosyltransferase family 2 protein [Gemmatimonadales bacterium]
MRVSIAIPLLNEEAVLPELVRRIAAALDGIPGGPHEVVFVDDGSTDATRAMLAEARRADGRIRAVLLSRNFGHQPAISAALDHVRGDVVIVMDGDLQDAPEEIPRFLAVHAEGYDVVYARRVDRKEGVVLRACYFLFYRAFARLSRVSIPIDAGDFALMSRRVVDAIRSAPERNRYLRGLRAWAGFRQQGIIVERAARSAGQSKYSYRALIRLALDGLFAFSIVPIRAAMFLGALTILVAMVFVLYAIYAKLMLHRSPQGFTAIILIMTFLSGVILFFLGVVGEYVGRVYEETKARPLYVVDRVLGDGD